MFNLRHSQARNVVERIFGVFKKRFQIFSTPPEYSIDTQARLVQALCVVHNITRIYDPEDMADFDEEYDIDEDDEEKGGLRGSITNAQKMTASNKRDEIAMQMWDSYQQLLRQRRRKH